MLFTPHSSAEYRAAGMLHQQPHGGRCNELCPTSAFPHPQVRRELPISVPQRRTEEDSAGLAQQYCTWAEITPPSTQRCDRKHATAARSGPRLLSPAESDSHAEVPGRGRCLLAAQRDPTWGWGHRGHLPRALGLTLGAPGLPGVQGDAARPLCAGGTQPSPGVCRNAPDCAPLHPQTPLLLPTPPASPPNPTFTPQN